MEIFYLVAGFVMLSKLFRQVNVLPIGMSF